MSSNHPKKPGSPDPAGVSTGVSQQQGTPHRMREAMGRMGAYAFNRREENKQCMGQAGLLRCVQKTILLFYHFCPYFTH